MSDKKTNDIKPTKEIRDALANTEKLNSFFRRNNYLVVVLLVAMMLITQCNNSTYKEETIKAIQENSKYLKKNIQTIGFVSATGALITIDRKPIDYKDERIKNAIVDLLSQPFLQGAEEIRKDKVYSSTKEMVRKNELFDYFYQNFVTPKAKKSVSLTMGGIYKTLTSLYYPEYVVVFKKKIINFSTERSYKHEGIIKFHTSVKYTIRTKSWIVQLDKWVDQDIKVVFDFDGLINSAKYANADNLLGFKITNLKIPLFQKPNISDLSGL